MNALPPKLLSRRQIPHPATFNSGPRITEVQTIDVLGKLVEVDIWTENGRIVRVGQPRPVLA